MEDKVKNTSGKLLEAGNQIAYIPMHANGDINHKDVQFGFVTSNRISRKAAFCRYWHSVDPKNKNCLVLRTRANSELTPWVYLEYKLSVAAFHVTDALKEINECT
jgi:hypothetical protein